METKSEFFQTKAFIDGDFIASESRSTFDVFNPYNSQLLASVADCNSDDALRAIDSAQRAFRLWKSLTGIERSKLLNRWGELMQIHKEELAEILTLEQGKPYKEAIAEINYGASFVEWFAEEAKRVYGDTIPGELCNKRIIVIKQPIGVVGAITPWNFPNAMITRKVAPALAVGCTIVVKPSELTPLSALALGALAKLAGIPKGVLNIVPSSKPSEIGNTFCNNDAVKKISFTGSTKIGKLLTSQSASTVKKLSLELGGNAPFIVFDDADLELAAQHAIAAKFRNAGQTCVSANRIFVQWSVYDEFLEIFTQKVSKLKVGNGLDANVDIGPLISEKAKQNVLRLVDDAVELGAKIFYQSKSKPKAESLMNPIVLTHLNPQMELFKKEIFGPIAPIYEFSTEQQVIELANRTPYGLASYFFGKDHSRIWSVAENLEYGMVGINTGMISTTVAPFGGVKQSGYGREGSKYGIDEFVSLKYLSWSI